MLDTFEILTTSGVVLWSRTYVPVGANVINSLIRDVFIEERIQPQAEDAGSKPTYKKEGYTLKWTAAKDLGLIFVVRLWHSKSMSAHDGTIICSG
jgi:signal recognition particle receptor subunit alpha